MNFRMLWERITAAVATVRAVWQCITASLGEIADGLKAERVQKPATDDPETGSDDS